MSVVENLEPKLLWKYFDEIRKIPRCSKHEEKIRKYILDFAKKLELKIKIDKPGNVVILKPASTGMENKPIVIFLNGHGMLLLDVIIDLIPIFTSNNPFFIDGLIIFGVI